MTPRPSATAAANATMATDGRIRKTASALRNARTSSVQGGGLSKIMIRMPTLQAVSSSAPIHQGSLTAR